MDFVEQEVAALPNSVAAERRVLELLAAGELRTDAARCAAAAILAKSDDVAAVRRGQELAMVAMGSLRAARVVAASCFDRLRVLAGEPQKFGTQRGPDGALLPVDPATTDSERAKWGLPPLRDLQLPPGSVR
jgi:hypothetical protein